MNIEDSDTQKGQNQDFSSQKIEELLMSFEENLATGSSVEHILLNTEDKYWDELWPLIVLRGYLYGLSASAKDVMVEEAWNEFVEKKIKAETSEMEEEFVPKLVVDFTRNFSQDVTKTRGVITLYKREDGKISVNLAAD